jgi:hypothetical protein
VVEVLALDLLLIFLGCTGLPEPRFWPRAWWFLPAGGLEVGPTGMLRGAAWTAAEAASKVYSGGIRTRASSSALQAWRLTTCSSRVPSCLACDRQHPFSCSVDSVSVPPTADDLFKQLSSLLECQIANNCLLRCPQF